MSQTGPWNKFSTDQRARDAAREAALAEGISLPEYLSRLLATIDDLQPSETHNSFTRRTGTIPPVNDTAATLDRLARRIEAAEARSTLAITGIDHAVHGLVARLQGSEQTTASIAGHVESLIEEMKATHETLQARVRRIEQDESGQRNLEALRALEGALGKLATHVYDEGELTQNETAAIKGRIESGFADLTDRVEHIETRVDRTLSEAAARVERAVQQAELRAEGSTRDLAERMVQLETQVKDKLGQPAAIEGRISAVEADVTGALSSMESTLLRIQERLNRAETGTDAALKSLETTFAHLDERIDEVARQVDPAQAERLKLEFERRFEDLTRSVRAAVDNTRNEIATEISRAAASQETRLNARLATGLGAVEQRLAAVEAREAIDVTATVQQELGRFSTDIAGRIDALAAQVEERLEESEHRGAEAIEMVGEQVTVAAVRLQKRQDEALTALAQDIDGIRKASDARLSDALASVSERLEKIQSQSSASLSPVQRAITALATRLESLESFATPPNIAPPPPVLPPGFGLPSTPPAAARVEPQAAMEAMYKAELSAPSTDRADDFQAGFDGWEVADAPETDAPGPYKADFDAIRSGAGPVAPARTLRAPASAADAGDDILEPETKSGFDPVAALDGLDLIDDSLEHSQSEARESDIFDDELPKPATKPNAAADESTSDYLARARRAALAAAEPPARNAARAKAKGAAAPAPQARAAPKPGGGKLPVVLAASAVVITGAGVGGYLYLRGKQPVAPSLSGPVDTYVDPATGRAAATLTSAPQAPAAARPVPLDAEQILFEDDVAEMAAALFDEPLAGASDAEPPPTEAATPKIAMVVTVPPESAAPSDQTALVAPSAKPARRVAPAATAAAPVNFTPRADATYPPIPAVVTVESEANAGNAVAQYQFAQVRMSEGDLDTAIVYLRRAAQKGVAPAQYELGKLFERGRGVDRDIIEARSLISKAAEAGHVQAMYDYALFLAEGEGGSKSETDAVRWFEAAAAHGLVDAQYNLGVVHAEGIGTEKNLAEALFWFEVAAKAGDEGARTEVANLRSRLPMDTSLDMRDRAAAWQPAAPVALANGKFGAQRWNTGNPLQVQAVQTALGRLGFEAGAPDGVLGKQTARAIREYQRLEGLEPTGTITPELVDHLNARQSATRSS